MFHKECWLYFRRFGSTAAKLLFSFQKGGIWMFGFDLIATAPFESFLLNSPPQASP